MSHVRGEWTVLPGFGLEGHFTGDHLLRADEYSGLLECGFAGHWLVMRNERIFEIKSLHLSSLDVETRWRLSNLWCSGCESFQCQPRE